MADLTTDSAVPTDRRILGLFAKAWDAGTVKTRLAATLGGEVAAEVYLELLVLQLLRCGLVHNRKIVAYSPSNEATRARFEELTGSLKPASKWDLCPQVESDLGTRMSAFFQQQFEAADESADVAAKGGPASVVLIGTDAPRLTAEIVETAFEKLANHDVVFGPSTDGGYYLVGLSQMAPSIFEGVQWSTEKVLQQSIDLCKSAGLSVAMLSELSDVDHEQDLHQELELLAAEETACARSFRAKVESILQRNGS